jgi:hypothetical protein
MKIIKKIIEPSYDRKPFYRTGECEKDFSFACDECGKSVLIDSKRLINNNWNGKTKSLTKRDFEFLKAYYKIGLVNKSADGGFPVFDKLTCSKCDSKYISYCGIIEFSNSAFMVTLNGLFKTENANLAMSVRNSIIEILDLLGDYENQIDYGKAVGDYIAIQEMVCMWFDDNYHPENENFVKAFSKKELIKLKEFNDFYEKIYNKIPDQNIRTLHIDQNWERLIRLAQKTVNEIKNETL